MAEYMVRGIGAKTGRSRNRTYLAASEQEARALAENDEMVVESVEFLRRIEPSESVAEWANNLGITVTSSSDYQDLMRQIREKEEAIRRKRAIEDPPAEDNIKAASQLGIECRDIISRGEFFGLVFRRLTEDHRESDLVAWFVYRITRSIAGRGKGLPGAEGPNSQLVRDIATELASDPRIVKSIVNNYAGGSLRWFGDWTAPDGTAIEGASKNTIAYKSAIAMIRPAFGLPTYEHRNTGGNKPKGPQSAITSNGGCLLPIIIAAILLAVLSLE